MSTVYNKVTVNNDTLIDISDTTAVASDVASGKQFYLATGEKATGTASNPAKIAEGTVAGVNDNYLSFTIGSKMAKTNFIINIDIASSYRQQPYDTGYKNVSGSIICDSHNAEFDLTKSGNINATPKLTFSVNNSGTITELSADGIYGSGYYLRNASISPMAVQPSYLRITRNNETSKFTIRIRFGTAKFIPNTTYNYHIYYYGSNPSAEVVDIA